MLNKYTLDYTGIPSGDYVARTQKFTSFILEHVPYLTMHSETISTNRSYTAILKSNLGGTDVSAWKFQVGAGGYPDQIYIYFGYVLDDGTILFSSSASTVVRLNQAVTLTTVNDVLFLCSGGSSFKMALLEDHPNGERLLCNELSSFYRYLNGSASPGTVNSLTSNSVKLTEIFPTNYPGYYLLPAIVFPREKSLTMLGYLTLGGYPVYSMSINPIPTQYTDFYTDNKHLFHLSGGLVIEISEEV